MLLASGVPSAAILVERFESGTTSEAAEPTLASTSSQTSELPARMTMHVDGAAHQVPYTPGDTLLQAAHKAGSNPASAYEDGLLRLLHDDASAR